MFLSCDKEKFYSSISHLPTSFFTRLIDLFFSRYRLLSSYEDNEIIVMVFMVFSFLIFVLFSFSLL